MRKVKVAKLAEYFGCDISLVLTKFKKAGLMRPDKLWLAGSGGFRGVLAFLPLRYFHGTIRDPDFKMRSALAVRAQLN